MHYWDQWLPIFKNERYKKDDFFAVRMNWLTLECYWLIVSFILFETKYIKKPNKNKNKNKKTEHFFVFYTCHHRMCETGYIDFAKLK